jgi:DNA primase
MAIPQSTIEQIKLRADILEVVGDFVSLKKKGVNYWACCPFHNEKSPSFSVNPAKGIYKCFGCGKAGDSIKFVMDVEGVSYPEALRYLAKKYQIEIEERVVTPEELADQTRRESLLIVMNFASQFYRNILQKNEGKSGLAYLKERGFSPETIQTFELGFSLPEWDGLKKEALTKGYREEYLEQTGLILKKEGGEHTYDRFRGRVMFPVHDLAGKVIAFGARTLLKDEKPKYLNSPETEIYKKSEVLYGIFQAKSAIRNEDNCLLTEAYTDVISLHQAGIKNVVASSGTSLTEGQIKLIRRFTDNVTILYDGDTAGMKAAIRGIDLLLEQGLNIRVLAFPEGEDPDSYVRTVGGVAFKNYLTKNARDFITFKTELLIGESKNDPILRAKAAKELAATIAKIADAMKRQVFAEQCAQLLHIDKNVLLAEINQAMFKEQHQKQQREQFRSQPNFAEVPPPTEYPYDLPPDIAEIFPDQIYIQDEAENRPTILRHHRFADIIKVHEQECIKLLLRYGQQLIDNQIPVWQYLLKEIDEIDFHTSIYKQVLDMYRRAIGDGLLPDADYFIHQQNPAIQELVINLTTDRRKVSEQWEGRYGIFVPHESDVERLPSAVYQNIMRLKLRVLGRLWEEVSEELRDAEKQNDLAEIERLLMTQMEINRIKKEVAKPLGIVYS